MDSAIKTGNKTLENNVNSPEYVLEIEHLKKSFDDKQVLNDISLKLKKGENLVVLGKSGHGKSVLIKCIVGLLTPDAGILKVFNKEITDLNKDELTELRRRIGFLFQNSALYDSMSVRENLEFPLQRQDEPLSKEELIPLIEEVLEAVGLLDAIDKMPSDLSGGMRKRIGLARTLILKPAIMLYDEPTTGLDPITSSEISLLILDIQKKYNTSSIIITHDMACAKVTNDRIMVLKEGEFIAEGSYEALENSEDEFVRSFFESTN
ncbi:ATP-binding cassette domain-containing protein [Solitalea sp. MAHUQ-68]|uniref:ATP-binding cassette domain-containing protein n=1 Tax=Solitalea agri TaxID=2953739 RepID=A0A9X2F5S5_9SPHI|nr:ATP-binding cassette domain-containing protein [Solitalea agri]MCO4294665.1 ATP-binding cassette domain-containing protein [Solitalea agri]